MKQLLRILSHFAGVIGAAIAIYLLCRECPTTDFKFDYIGVIIGILTLLVTLLVAWNIYSAICVEQRVNNAIRQQEVQFRNQDRRYEDFRQEVNSKIESLQQFVTTQLTMCEGRLNSAEKAYISLFNTTQAQVAAVMKEKDYLQQYSYYQTALNALLQCEKFPSDIRVNIKVILAEMEELLNLIEAYGDKLNGEIYKLYDEDKKEFIQNMEEISKTSRGDFSFENRQKFMEIAAKAKFFFKRATMKSETAMT